MLTVSAFKPTNRRSIQTLQFMQAVQSTCVTHAEQISYLAKLTDGHRTIRDLYVTVIQSLMVELRRVDNGLQEQNKSAANI